ncbi:MAG: Sugar-phosphate isomerase, RpiB/LacA/LacB family [Candidatus Magasanikbacteria bacterium GW2011_GWC2_37_14]|uniref:Sugar-phosphate isomerase, RpiB/LacA/LacB family n=1 Tax=Candidatus Magasanikbacteria bacterium GW2011_GWC2_37_14 TaxID=1619046 RepID=A0A0G0GC58_9BACT|nr:MAG: Sugar-phosphate isomerase, RpiB/LacA/LacB family [Candidatus Magasanikbacteria bacterium GW2011_GWC2_37_14]
MTIKSWDKRPLYLAADHGGYQLKKRLARYLKNELKIKFIDLGAKTYNEQDDYPDFIIPAAKKTVKTNGRGIFICGSGTGVCMAANKVKGMRAALAYNIESARLSRLHNNSNGLCLGGRVLSEDHAMAIVKKWLETEEFLGGKYERRNKKLEKLENKK